MDGSQQESGGFTPGVMDQLQQIASSTPRNQRGRGQGRRGGRGGHQGMSQSSSQDSRSYPSSTSNMPQPVQRSWNTSVSSNQNDMNSFPPLESARAVPQTSPIEQFQQNRVNPQQQQFHQQNMTQAQQYAAPRHQYRQMPQYQDSQPAPQYHQMSSQTQTSFNQQAQGSSTAGDRKRGGYNRGGSSQYRGNNQQYSQSRNYYGRMNSNDSGRPVPNNTTSYTQNKSPHYGTAEQQRTLRHKVMAQSDFLASIASQALKNQMTIEEAQKKEAFRKTLQAMAQEAIASIGSGEVRSKVSSVKLRLYGSLGSGFGVAGSDMDLLLAFPQEEGPLREVEIESRRALEKALLDVGYGARLLTNTRVPILKVCELPTPTLLKNLRDYRTQWELSEKDIKDVEMDKGNLALPNTTDDETATTNEAFQLLDLNAADVPLPASPTLEHAKLDFFGDCGIQCDINFSNYVALHNTELLKTYGQCDGRVRQVGMFVKNWAKARDINTPYKGTLSSYGYIMMVLHYLMNVVKPPVIPNLQHLAKGQDGWDGPSDVVLVEGCDVRFVREPEQIKIIMQNMIKNHESVGSLLRGFFWYYASRDGFHYNQNVISIRNTTGELTKQSKGWTEAKWSNQHQHVRLRYLLAIEDPFEIDHNIGRTVGHNGLVAIRDEFRRAWSMIQSVHIDEQNKTWVWINQGEKQSAEDFMVPREDRGDLLRKDQDYHKEKMRRMRDEAEAREHALKEESLAENAAAEETEKYGTWMDINSECPSGDGPPQLELPDSKLIHHPVSQIKNQYWKSRPSRRQVEVEQEDFDDTQVSEVVESCPSPVARENWENEVDPMAYMTSSKDTWGPQAEAEPVELNIPTDSPVDKGMESVGGGEDWENVVDPMAYMTAQKDTWGAQPGSWTDTPQAESSDVKFQNKELAWEEPVQDRSEQLADPSEEAEIRKEIISQRQDQFSILGDKVFARNTKAQTRLEPHNQPPRADRKVGRYIQWDQLTVAGRWLRWRDGQIQAGSWMKPQGTLLRDLDTRFPHNPEMSYADLAILNAKLRSQYDNVRYPIKNQPYERSSAKKETGSSWQNRRVAIEEDENEESKSLEEQKQHQPSPWKSEAERRQQVSSDWVDEKLSQDIVHLSSADKCKIEGVNQSLPEQETDFESSSQSTSAQPLSSTRTSPSVDLEYVRNARMRHFSGNNSAIGSECQSSQVGDCHEESRSDLRLCESRAGTLDNLRQESFAPKPRHRAKKSKRSGAQKEQRKSQDSTIPVANQPIMDHQKKLLSLLNIKSAPEKAPSVISTSGVDISDQNDKCFESKPAPRNHSFRLDSKQIAYMDVIKHGGNGCAKNGEEYNIEQNYEFGGGGAMGYRSSSEAQDTSHSGGGGPSSWQAGKGDEEGLLEELPRSV